MKNYFDINGADGGGVLVSQNKEHISLGLLIENASCRIDLTPAQAQELINAIAQTLNQETTA